MINNKKDRGSGTTVFMCLMTLFMIIIMLIVIFFSFDRVQLNNSRVGISNNMILSSLSASLVDFEKSAAAGVPIVTDEGFQNSDYQNFYDAYKKSLYTNLGINLSTNNPNENSKYYNWVSNFSIDDIIIYQPQTNGKTYVTKYTNGLKTEETLAGIVVSPNNVTIEDTCCYAKVSFNLKGSLNESGRYSREIVTKIKLY